MINKRETTLFLMACAAGAFIVQLMFTKTTFDFGFSFGILWSALLVQFFCHKTS